LNSPGSFSQTVLPDQSQALLPEFGADLVTLVTCTPLGINSHRYLVTAERVLPTPAKDIAAAGELPDIPGFPWWSVMVVGALGAYATIVLLAGRTRPTPKQEVDSDEAAREIIAV